MPNAKSRTALATELSKLIKSVQASEVRAKTDAGRLQFQMVRDYLQSGYLILTADDDVVQSHDPEEVASLRSELDEFVSDNDPED